jgi:hypothetical protein
MEKKIMVKLVSISSVPRADLGCKPFYPCTVEFTTPNGELVQRSARVWEGNYNYGVSVGETYSATARVYVDSNNTPQVDITVSHLQGTNRASLDDFGFEAPVVPTTSKADFAG